MLIAAIRRQVVYRIVAVSLLLAVVSSYGAWLLSVSTARHAAIALTLAESRRLKHDAQPGFHPDQVDAQAAQHLIGHFVGGLFDVAEIYTSRGEKLAVGMTQLGKELEGILHEHQHPQGEKTWSEVVVLPDERQVLRVVVPLSGDPSTSDSGSIGYFEGMRLISEDEQRLVRQNAWVAALWGGGAALLCGFAVYPFVMRLGAATSRKSRDLLAAQLALMEALGKTIEQRDQATGGHNYRVTWIASQIGEAVGLERTQMQALIVGSFLHDVGKVGIPDAVLLKPDRLDADEYDIMRSHVTKGEAILNGIDWLEKSSEVVSGHHERWDGTGYPRGLSGQDIPILARIFAVADVFDALCSERPYKGAYGFDTVMDMLNGEAGRHFDPAVLRAFSPIAREIYDILADCEASDCQFLLEQRVRNVFG